MPGKRKAAAAAAAPAPDEIPDGIFAEGDEVSDEVEASVRKDLVGGVHIDQFMASLFDSIVGGISASNKLPQEDDYEFQCAFRAFPREMKMQRERLLQLCERVAEVHTGAKRKPQLRQTQDDRDRLDQVVDVVDSMLETVDLCVDKIKAGEGRKEHSKEERLRERQKRMAELSGRPQSAFKRPPDNSEGPWRPLLFRPDGTLEFGRPGTHPYGDLIQSHELLDWQTKAAPKRPYASLEDAPCHYIDRSEQLAKLAKVLLAQDEFAVDLEAHSYHTYLGFCCLMQISTREEDYIVDVLALRDEMYRLLPAFVNPKIVKVMHGAIMDIKWLQRDFGLYVVNMFDTGAAATQLSMPAGLGHLLRYFCDVNTDKRFQTADWRQRPLPEDMLRYARMDTHYLLYIADQLRNRLLVQEARPGVESPLLKVLQDSRELCLKLYQKPTVAAFEASIHRRYGEKRLGVPERVALRACLEWRDAVAREEDESNAAVLPDNSVLTVAQEAGSQRLAPRDLCKLFMPCPPLLRKHVARLAKALAAARAAPSPGGTAPSPGRSEQQQGGEDASMDDGDDDGPARDRATLPTEEEQAEWMRQLPSIKGRPVTCSPLFAAFGREGELARRLGHLKVAMFFEAARGQRVQGIRRERKQAELRREEAERLKRRPRTAPASAGPALRQADLGEEVGFGAHVREEDPLQGAALGQSAPLQRLPPAGGRMLTVHTDQPAAQQPSPPPAAAAAPAVAGAGPSSLREQYPRRKRRKQSSAAADGDGQMGPPGEDL
eukprot:TRINITY_DN13074_c0_g1_i1.p1 TRINITY_DN13074_c0_g1~~TRINITY_DN13074_c0_g1_i1.p1  ORF type:complete len:801 (+),score=330.61 TRINITY_DN13074_c0_g1_i1:87-2405(+)